MKKNNRVKYILLGLLLTTAFVAGWSISPGTEVITYLPSEVIEVKTVKYIDVPVEIEVPGPVKVVEKIVWRTKTETVEIDVIREVVKIVEVAAETGDIEAWIDITAYKYEGLNTGNGKYEFGWKGYASCSMESGDLRAVLTEQEFDLSRSISESIYFPKATRRPWTVDTRLGVTSAGGMDFGLSWHRRSRWGLYAGIQRDSFTYSVPIFSEDISYASIQKSLSNTRAYGGLSFRFGRRYP